MKLNFGICYFSMFVVGWGSPLHGRYHQWRRNRYLARDPVTTIMVAGTTTTTTSSALQSCSTASQLTAMLPGATVLPICTLESPCVGDITNYDPSVGVGACGGRPYQATDDVIAIAYGMMGSLSSGNELNPLCGRSVQIANPANNKTAQGIAVDKCGDCVSKKVFSL